MPTKTFLTAFISLCLFITATAQSKQPFAEIGKKAKTLTLTDGKYEESFDDDSIQRIGSALVNINTMKVVKVQLSEEEQRQLDNLASGRFLSVDPITKKYAQLTPYQFASNTPIFGVDRDGLELWGNNLLFDIWLDWKFGDPTGIKTLKSGLQDKAAVKSGDVSYHNDNVPERVQKQLDDVNNIEANAKIAAGIAGVVKFNIKTSFDVVLTIAPIGEGTALIFRGSKSAVVDIALGLRNGSQLPEFANSVKALHVDDWAKNGLFNKDATNFADAFKQAVDKVIKSGGKIKFDITGLDLKKAASAVGKSLYDEGVGYTDWEFSQVTNNSKLLKSTEFYRGGKLVKTEDVLKEAKTK